MIIRAFTMKLHDGKVEEYRRRHEEIWPDLTDLLFDYGINEYSIHLDEETHVLFAIQKLNTNHKADELANHHLMKKWWAYMADIMETNMDDSPIINTLTPVFILENELSQNEK